MPVFIFRRFCVFVVMKKTRYREVRGMWVSSFSIYQTKKSNDYSPWSFDIGSFESLSCCKLLSFSQKWTLFVRHDCQLLKIHRVSQFFSSTDGMFGSKALDNSFLAFGIRQCLAVWEALFRILTYWSEDGKVASSTFDEIWDTQFYLLAIRLCIVL